MGKARSAGFRQLRGAGWSMALPIAGVLGAVTGVIFSSVQIGLLVGTAVSTVGLMILWIGYALGDILEGYWVTPAALVGVNIALVTYVLGGDWRTVLVLAGAVILLIACVGAIARTSRGNGGLRMFARHLLDNLIPGRN